MSEARTWKLPVCGGCGAKHLMVWRDDAEGHVTPCLECGSREAEWIRVVEIEKIKPIPCRTDREARMGLEPVVGERLSTRTHGGDNDG